MSSTEQPFDFVPGVRALGTFRRPGPAPVAASTATKDFSTTVRFSTRSLPPIPRSSHPDTRPLEEKLAARFRVAPERVMVACGADDALDRLTRVTLSPGRGLVLPGPTFEMLPRYATLTGADTVTIPWMSGPFPIDQALAAIGPATRVVLFVTPQIRPGAVGTAKDLERLSAALPHGLLVCDFAYAEYADEDLTAHALTKTNTVVFRTFSKAWGLAGARLGYVFGPPRTC